MEVCPHEPLPSFGLSAFFSGRRLQRCIAEGDLASFRLASAEGRYYSGIRPQSPAKISLRIAPYGSGILSLVYFQNGDERCCTGVTFSRQEWLRPWRWGSLAWPPRRPNLPFGRANGAALP